MHNQFKEAAVGEIVAFGEIAHVMQCARENVGIFVNTSVEDGGTRVAGGFEILFGAVTKGEPAPIVIGDAQLPEQDDAEDVA